MNIKQYDDLIELVELEIKNSIIVYDFKELIDLDIDQIDDYITENYDDKYRVLKVQLAYKYHMKSKWAFLLKKYRENPLYNQKTYSQLLKCVDKESKSKKDIMLCVLKKLTYHIPNAGKMVCQLLHIPEKKR